MAAQPEPRPPWLAIGLLSGAALCYEILLIRLLSQVHWYSLVALVISLALLGYGASGTFLSLLTRYRTPPYGIFFVLNSLLFAFSSVLFFQLARMLPLNPMEMAWDWRQLVYFAALYLLLAVPFFTVANAIGLTFWRFPALINRAYAADLVGAGIGTALVLLVLLFWLPDAALRLVAVGGILAALLALTQLGERNRPYLVAFCALALPGVLMAPAGWFSAPAAGYKALSQALSVKGAYVSRVTGNPLGVVTVVESPEVPFRRAPGLSLASPQAAPGSTPLFLDGDSHGVLYSPTGPKGHFDYMLSAVAYHLVDSPGVLLAGAHDGVAIGQALSLGAARVDVVEPNPLLSEMLKSVPGQERLVMHNETWRRFLRYPGQQYDLIQISGGDAIGSVSGLRAQQERYGYTVEAFMDALQRLSPAGVISVTRGIQMPPRASLKLAATAIEALRRVGVTQPSGHLAVLRSWNSFTLLVRRQPFSESELQLVREFSRQRMFDLVYLPGLRSEETNRYNRLGQPLLHQGVMALMGAQAGAFIAGYDFNIQPATDDNPFFNRFTRPGRLPQLLNLPGSTGLAQVDWGYFMLLAALGLALISGLVLILLPLTWLKPGPGGRMSVNRHVILYFSAIGLAFLFVEIAFIQIMQLFLGAPIYAVAVVLGGFLVAAGAGSFLSQPFVSRLGSQRTIGMGVVLICIQALCYLLFLPMLFEWSALLGLGFRVLLCLLLIVPLGVAMGVPFPVGLGYFGGESQNVIPWGWGINGCASVISAILAPLLAMEIGFSGTVMIALFLYLVAYATVVYRGRVVSRGT
jgi:hypothetical protein